MTARNDDDRRHDETWDAGDERGRDAYDGDAYDGAAYDGAVYDGDVYDGMDPLMAVVAGEPLPRAARRDADFMAAHRAAAADVALLRQQLGLIGDTLAHEAEAEAEAGPSAEPGGGAAVTPLSGRRRRPRAVVVAVRGLAAAVAATVVVGMGWLVVQSGGTGNDEAGSSSADTAAGAEHGDRPARLSHPGYLACARLVVEGTVAEVEAVPGTGQDRVTLDVARHYKPAEGQDQVVFPLDAGIDPPPRPGDHVLVAIRQGHAEPDLWTTDEKEIARERAWITAALAESRTYPCEE
ncbi:hypothetical protein [Streptomyces lomondensis]|uniref:Uncharacterized protein n=1 Tax=Streptomyces lomondensis TaxID=68229 RepID=A0ABQ2WX21_9ACTN|nr:hypothetical protein [Streptomyces lomondensis]MCF0082992.1 hypothetical protein [Streptomyces lomondensis]GGW79959.1 hypothetical protein GCM10010383_04470 [Streptomyces lomondensis]